MLSRRLCFQKRGHAKGRDGGVGELGPDGHDRTSGDRDAFSRLVERHYDRISRVGARVFGNETDAADLAQDVCIGLVTRLFSYRGESAFTTRLYMVTINAAHDRLRRDGARRRAKRCGRCG